VHQLLQWSFWKEEAAWCPNLLPSEFIIVLTYVAGAEKYSSKKKQSKGLYTALLEV
jgi:hypothetical protein